MFLFSSVGVFFMSFFLLFISSSVYMLWASMELLSFSVVMFLFWNMKWSMYVNKSSVFFKYFIFQMVSSVSVLVCMLISTKNFMYFLCCFLSLKIGVFPSFMWVPEMYSVLTFLEMIFMGVVPKIPPLYLLFYFQNNYFIMICSFLTIFFGGLSSLNYGGIRYIMGFSSLMNSSWLVFSLLIDVKMLLLMLCVYFWMTAGMYLYFKKRNLYFFFSSQFSKYITSFLKSCASLIFFFIMSIPFGMMFFYKFFIISHMATSKFIYSTFFFFLLFINSLNVVMYMRSLYFFLSMLESSPLFSGYLLFFKFSFYQSMFYLLMVLFSFVCVMFFF